MEVRRDQAATCRCRKRRMPRPVRNRGLNRKTTPEGRAEARKIYGYDCAMCHGKEGDGKGDLAQDMKLELHDWRDPSTIEKMTDGELFWVVSYGRGKMVGGEVDRSPEKLRWNLVNLIRSFGKKGAAAPDKPKTENPRP